MNSFRGLVREAQRGDLPNIRSIVEEWHADVSRTMLSVEQTISGDKGWRYLVAQRNDGQVVGMIGLATSGVDPGLLNGLERTAELVSAYVSNGERGTGAGRALAEEIEKVAARLGFARLLVVSGSNNKAYGYPFWRVRYGEPIRVDADYFAPGAERVVWAKELS